MSDPAHPTRSEVRDGMRIDFHVPIPVADGTVLDADVFRPVEDGRYPVIMTHGPYAKGLAFQDPVYGERWENLVERAPDVLEGSSNLYQNWETVDPERWVPQGYAVVRVDSRGAGWSPGYLDIPMQPAETDDYYECIEWAARQPWSDGNIGLCGISYYASNQWLVAARRPPSLKAIVAWEGWCDHYRGPIRHGGIRSQFLDRWYQRVIEPHSRQYGAGEKTLKSRVTGESIAGGVTLSDEELERNRVDLVAEMRARPLMDDWYRERTPRLEDIEVPLLSAGNWGGQGVHLTGNVEGFLAAGSEQKWLEFHGDTHYTHFYSSYGRSIQKQFLDHFLKGVDNGWSRRPPVLLNVRHPGERFVPREEHEWPLARTEWTSFYLDPGAGELSREAPVAAQSLTYEAMGDEVRFAIPPQDEPFEVTGPLAAKLFVSSSTVDADVFLTVRVFDPRGEQVTFVGANNPEQPMAYGWLRASHRRLDEQRSEPWRPVHTHEAAEPLEPGEIYELDVEIWPTCIVVPAGHRFVLDVSGHDDEDNGRFRHEDPVDRPPEVFDNRVTLHCGPEHPSRLLVPIIPPK